MLLVENEVLVDWDVLDVLVLLEVEELVLEVLVLTELEVDDVEVETVVEVEELVELDDVELVDVVVEAPGAPKVIWAKPVEI